MSEPEHNAGYQAIVTAARKGMKPEPIGSDLFVIPHGPAGQAMIVDTEGAHQAPRRPSGTTTVYGAAAFNQLVKDAVRDGARPYIYIDRDVDRPQIVAVLNGHDGLKPGWGDYRVQIVLRPTAQWVKWNLLSGKLLPQEAFAEFVEENRDDIADPPGATMLEIVTYLEATKSASFKSGLRLQSGSIQLENIENTEARVGSGRIEVPETFHLGIQPFVGGARYQVPARFRFRIDGGKLRLGFLLQRREDLVGSVINDLVAAIDRGTDNAWSIDGVAPLLGDPARRAIRV